MKWVSINGTALNLGTDEWLSSWISKTRTWKEEDIEYVKRDRGNGCLGGRVCSPLLEVGEPDELQSKFTLLMSVGEGRGDHVGRF